MQSIRKDKVATNIQRNRKVVFAIGVLMAVVGAWQAGELASMYGIQASQHVTVAGGDFALTAARMIASFVIAALLMGGAAKGTEVIPK